MVNKPTIAIDFDGTIVDHAFPAIGALKPGVKDALTKLSQIYSITIFSVRPTWGVFNGYPECFNEMVAFLKANEIPFDHIATKEDGKPLAEYYIDDRAVEFKDNWLEIVKRLTPLEAVAGEVQVACVMCQCPFYKKDVDFVGRCDTCFKKYMTMPESERPKLGVPFVPIYNGY